MSILVQTTPSSDHLLCSLLSFVKKLSQSHEWIWDYLSTQVLFLPHVLTWHCFSLRRHLVTSRLGIVQGVFTFFISSLSGKKSSSTNTTLPSNIGALAESFINRPGPVKNIVVEMPTSMERAVSTGIVLRLAIIPLVVSLQGSKWLLLLWIRRWSVLPASSVDLHYWLFFD